MRRSPVPAAAAIALLALAGAWQAPAAAFPRLFKAPAYPTAQEQFEYAASREKAEDFNGAMDAYQRLVDDFGDSPLAAEAQFRVAEMLEKTKRYYPAFNAYQAVLDKFPSYPKVNLILERQFRIANLFLSGTEVGFLRINPSGSLKRAIAAFGKLLSNAPFSDYAPNAQYNLGLAHLERKNYTEAAIEFEKVIARSPRSEFVAAAKFQLGVCAYRQALAAQYDQEAAREAINRLADYLAEFPSDKNAEPAKEMIQELQGRKAGALFQIGCYYRERDNPKAALIYLREVIRDYPLTRYGEKARRAAQREERRLEFAEGVGQAQEAVDELRRLIASQRSAIAAIRRKGQTRWAFWRYVLPRTLTPEEAREVDEREDRIRALRERLALAALDLEEKTALARNRRTLLDAEAAVESEEEAMRATQLELQVAQNRFSEMGSLPEAAAEIVEQAARGIAAMEERVRKQEVALEQLKKWLGEVESRCAAEDQRIRERYAQKRPGRPAAQEEGAPEPRRGWWPFRRASSAPPEGGQASAGDAASAPPSPLRRLWPFTRPEAPRPGEASAGTEETFREAEEFMAAARRHRLDRQWGPALEAFNRAALKLMEIRSGQPAYRSAEVHRRLQECRDAIEEAREESARAQYDELSADLEARLEKNPDDADALVSLGAIRRRRGDARGAIDCFRKAVGLKPDKAEGWHLLGAASASAGDLRTAELCLRKAVERAPSAAQVRYDLGLVQRELGEYEAARASFEEAVAADPSFAPAWFSLGALYQSALSDRAKAAECWERYLQLKPDAPEAPRIREWIDRQRGPAEIRASTASGELAPPGSGGQGWGGLFRRDR